MSFACCKIKSVLKMELSAALDQGVTRGDGEDPEVEGNQVSQGDRVPQEDQGQRDLLVSTDQ